METIGGDPDVSDCLSGPVLIRRCFRMSDYPNAQSLLEHLEKDSLAHRLVTALTQAAPGAVTDELRAVLTARYKKIQEEEGNASRGS